jgi:hypothetical protein
MLVEDGDTDFCGYLEELDRHLRTRGFDHELIVAVNGPGAFARGCLRAWPVTAAPVRIFELTRRVPSSICLQTVLPQCRGEILIVCGPYRQIADQGLDALLEAVALGAADMALPWRQRRVDPAVNQWQSRLFNWLVRRLTGAAYHDLSTNLRVVRRQVLEETPLYGDLYRYLPLLACQRGFRVREIPAPHNEERGKVGYYGLREYVSRLVDLLAMQFNFGFARKPLRYFGLRGVVLVFLGMLGMTWAVVLKMFGSGDLGDSLALMVGLVLVLTGSGIWGVGLLGEVLTFTLGRKRKDYIIEQKLE